MTDSALGRVTPESMKEFRNLMKETCEVDADQYDPRDIDDIKNQDWFASGFIQWKEKLPDAVELAKKTLKWRKDNGIRELSVSSIGEELFKKGLLYTTGRAKDGSRLLFLNCKLHSSKLKEEHKKLLWFWCERMQRSEPGKKVTFVLDVPGASISNVDNSFNNIIIATFTNNFPSLVSRFIVWDMPWIFTKIWALVKRLLSEKQREHTMFCTESDIDEYIDEENRLTSMGGKNSFEYSFPPFPDDLKQ